MEKKEKKSNKIEVVFLRGSACAPYWMAYTEGDRAKIDPDMAKRLIKDGFAMNAKDYDKEQKAES